MKKKIMCHFYVKKTLKYKKYTPLNGFPRGFIYLNKDFKNKHCSPYTTRKS